MGCGASSGEKKDEQGQRYQKLQATDCDQHAAHLLDAIGIPLPENGEDSPAQAQGARLFGKVEKQQEEHRGKVSVVLDALAATMGRQAVIQDAQAWESDARLEEMPGSPMAGHTASRGLAPPEDVVTFVFTDIANSTALWELATESMDFALSLHNEVMREAVTQHRGYEVKTIGDAFFLAFHETADAMRCMLQMQTQLNEQSWPSALHKVKAAATVPHPRLPGYLYTGLRVRMGCHVGEVITEINPLTGRADYRGPTVNVAARVEGQGKGGIITITSDVLEALKDQLDQLGDPEVQSAGERKLKGVAEPIEIFFVAPPNLAERVDEAVSGVAPASPQAKKGLDTGPGLGKRLGMRLRRSQATVASTRPLKPLKGVQADAVCDQLCDAVRCAEVAAAETEGLVEEVQGDFINVSWNTVRGCPCHVQQSLRWCAMVQSRRHGTPASGFGAGLPEAGEIQQFVIGVASGKFLYGSVGTARRTFHVVVGDTPRLAQQLCGHCAMLSCVALFCDWHRAADRSTGITDYLRPVDFWEAHGKRLIVEELDLGGIGAAEEDYGIWDFLAVGQSAGMGGGEAVNMSPSVAVKSTAGSTGKARHLTERLKAAVGGDAQATEELRTATRTGDGLPDVPLRRLAAILAARSGAAAGKAEPAELGYTPPALRYRRP